MSIQKMLQFHNVYRGYISIEHDKLVTSLFVWDPLITAKFNISPLRLVENMLIINKRLKTERE